MSSDINLLPEKRKSSYRYRQIVKVFKIVSIAILIVITISSITVFFLKSRSSLPSLEKEEKDIISNINLQSTKAVKFILVSTKLKSISEIITKRADFSKRITTVMQKIPEDVSIDSFSIGENGLGISASCNSLYFCGVMFDEFTSMVAGKDLFKYVYLKNLTYNVSNNKYLFSLSIAFL